jgi:hypothetical protein
MRVLEARFRSHDGADGAYLVVAHIVWDGDAKAGEVLTVEPSAALRALARPAPMLAKLRFLVENTAPETFVRLQRLKSRFWSFVEVGAPHHGRILL